MDNSEASNIAMLIDKELWIDALCGMRLTMHQKNKLESVGLMTFSGNNHNYNWEFIRDKLDAHTEDELKDLYFKIREINSKPA